MASEQSYVEHICDQADLTESLSYKKMFGEYALYLHEKVVALVCDNQLFVKPTAEGERLLGVVQKKSPYPGAKPHLLVEDLVEDRELLKTLLLITFDALPPPKPKQSKKSTR